MFILVAAGIGASHVVRPPERSTAMTFNVRHPHSSDSHSWSQRRVGIKTLLNDQKPDIIGFQEVTAPMEHDLAAMLGKQYAHYGKMRSADSDSEMTPIFVNTTKFRVLDKGTFFLSETPDTTYSRGWDAKYPRVATWMALGEPGLTNASLVVINTHLDHKGGKAQAESGKLIARRAKALGGRFDAPTLIMGDFNSSPVDPSITSIWQSGDFTDSYHALDVAEQDNALTSHGDSYKTLGKPIDYISAEKPLTISNAAILREKYSDVWPSDHYPVIVTVTQ